MKIKICLFVCPYELDMFMLMRLIFFDSLYLLNKTKQCFIYRKIRRRHIQKFDGNIIKKKHLN